MAIALFATVLVVLADIISGPLLNFAIFKSAALITSAAARSRKVLWAMCILLLITTFGVSAYEIQKVTDVPLAQTLLINRVFTALTLILIAIILHLWIGADTAAQSARIELEQQNEELAQGEEEISRQNEELQSQTEELERQGEELRVTNEELAQRERMLETMLDLSRSLHVGLSKDDAMTRICETLGQLVNGPSVATAILLHTPQGLQVKCHYGFGPAGIQTDVIPAERSFAALVIEQGRTGYLDDLSLRPELQVPQPAEGAALVSVLATPLMVSGKPVGTVELYGRDRRQWDDEQIALIESLAAQTSISLENAALFEEIDRSRRRLATILENIPIGLSIANVDVTDFRFNAAGAAIIGAAPDVNLAGEFARRTWIISEEGKQLPLERYPISRATRGERVFPHEMEVLLPTGRRLTVLSSAAPFYDAEGKIIGAVSCFADITQLKSLQRELDTRRREAEEANVRKSRFLAAASHDIRTPANAISLLAELLKRTADSPSMAAEIPQLADELRNSANSLVNLVSNVLDVTRFDTDKLELHETEFPLAQLLDEETRQVQPLAHAKKLSLDVEHCDKSLWLRADRIKLGRVMGNLLGNAIKFTDSGAIHVSSRLDGGPVEIIVRDTGIGITPENQSRIFDEFFQLSDPSRSKGSGLGLAISKRLVEAMGGTISVTSTRGNGSTFKVTLPRNAIVQQQRSAPPPTS